jgi:acetyl-CoA carboxylase biotin carboxyl carrier protein
MITATSAALFALGLIIGFSACYFIYKKKPQNNDQPTDEQPSATQTGDEETPDTKAVTADDETIRSPLPGTFHMINSPDGDSLIKSGSHAEKDQDLCIIESMKMDVTLKVEQNCQIISQLVKDGDPVEFNQPLFKVKRK